jgi:hypothetical protein
LILIRILACIAQLDLTYLTEDQPQEDGHEDRDKPKDKNGKIITAFDRLVLPPGHQDLILSLVTQHFRDKASDDDDKDFVRGKGK